ncbi:MAG: LamG-like jellyroll fold domain-containing protein [Xanthomonadales bacterium]|nr:LamG-like jellyroll fold domain-containing protein [Xanthomonadales bacterium]
MRWLLLLALPAALEFGGSGVASPTLDRAAIPLVAGNNLGAGAFTLELFVRVAPGSNLLAPPCGAAADAWIHGHVLLDRDVYGPGDFGDFGASLMQGRVAFGVNLGASGATACGSSDLRDGLWHHLALVRAADGTLRIFVDGVLEGSVAGPVGDVSYRLGRPSSWPWDPFLVIGAEKHDAGPSYPSFAGRVAELTALRPSPATTPPSVRRSLPSPPMPTPWGSSRCDEGAGTTLRDRAGVQDGERRVNPGCLPRWRRDAPGRPSLHDDGFEC